MREKKDKTIKINDKEYHVLSSCDIFFQGFTNCDSL